MQSLPTRFSLVEPALHNFAFSPNVPTFSFELYFFNTDSL